MQPMVSVPPLRGRLGGGYSSLDRVVSIDLELSLNFISFMVFPVFVLTPNRSSDRLTTNRSSDRLMCYHSSSGVSFPKSGSIFRNAVTRNVMVQQSITMMKNVR